MGYAEFAVDVICDNFLKHIKLKGTETRNAR